jgi:hypothetical protein
MILLWEVAQQHMKAQVREREPSLCEGSAEILETGFAADFGVQIMADALKFV